VSEKLPHDKGEHEETEIYLQEEYLLMGYGLPPAFTLVSCLAYSILKKEMICSSETSVNFQRTTQRYIPEDRTLRNQCCENLKSYKLSEVSVSVPLLYRELVFKLAGFSPFHFIPNIPK
jgi:hypothetical protein